MDLHTGEPRAGDQSASPYEKDCSLVPDTARVLIIDDNPTVLESYRKILSGDCEGDRDTLAALETSLFGVENDATEVRPAFLVDMVSSGEQGRDKVLQARRKEHPYEVAFVDMRMPGGWDGLATVEALWRVDPDVQVVICSAYSDYSWDEIVARLGQSDRLLILRKPFETIEVLQLACALSAKWRLHRRLRTHLDELESNVRDRDNRLQRALTVCEDFEARLQHLDAYDQLTGLPNRRLLIDRMERAIARASRREERFVVCFINLDHFKWINDHTARDELLVVMSRRMVSCVRESDAVARLGGDEFVLLLGDCNNEFVPRDVIERLMACVSEPVSLAGVEVAVTCSAGCSTFPEDGDDADSLLRFANAAMYSAKTGGRNCIRFYNAKVRAWHDERAQLQAELQQAVQRGEFQLHYQPQVDLRSGRVVSVEALLRWYHPKLGQVSPARFIPLAEEIGTIGPITEWVIRQACDQARAWLEMGLPPFRVAVNVSAKLLGHPELETWITEALTAAKLDPSWLEIELTESAAMDNPDLVIPVMLNLKRLGVSLSIDDFGTGYSNMHYLRRFPVDGLKLDGSFVREITNDPRSLAIAEAIITMAHRLELRVIAEMAETEEQVIQLASRGCDLVQGYYFSRPLDVGACTRLLLKGALPLPALVADKSDQRVLLVLDNEPEMTTAVRHELRAEGYRILCANNTVEAFDLLARHPVGVVLTEYRLPDSNGVEFLSKVKHMYPKATRVLCTGHKDFEIAASAINRSSVHGVLSKPWDGNRLRETVSSAFRSFED